jgi:hypothetical protein
MKIYFTASGRGKKLYDNNYKKIAEVIEKQGHKNLDRMILDINPKEFYLGCQRDRQNLYKNTINKIKDADIVILEVSVPSLSIGYVLDKSLAEGKPVIAIYVEGLNPYFAEGIQDERLQVLPYRVDELEKLLAYAIDEAKQQLETRFTMILPPDINSYLNEATDNRSEYIRRLIRQDMSRKK